MKLTFLGTGTSFGIPKIGCHCAVCRSPDPRDKRNRVGAVVESNFGTRLLIDTPPELRLQLVAAGIDRCHKPKRQGANVRAVGSPSADFIRRSA